MPAAVCAGISKIVGAYGGVISLLFFPLVVRLATWLCFRMQWRETPWFIGLFIAVPGSCIFVMALGLPLATLVPEGWTTMETEIWVAWISFATAIAVAIELAVANQLLQRSTIKDVLIAALAGSLSMVTIKIASPVLRPLANALAPPPLRFMTPSDPVLYLANLVWIVAVMINTGMAILRRARKTTEDKQRNQVAKIANELQTSTHRHLANQPPQ